MSLALAAYVAGSCTTPSFQSSQDDHDPSPTTQSPSDGTNGHPAATSQSDHLPETLEVALEPEVEEALEALGYVESTPTNHPELRGVTTGARRDDEALYLFSSRRRARATLVNRNGESVHSWHPGDDDTLRMAWMHVEPLSSGELLILAKDRFLAKVDWHSQLVWQHPHGVHHDVAVRNDGSLVALLRGRESLPIDGHPVSILSDAVAFLDRDGKLNRRVLLLPLLRAHVERQVVPRIRRRLTTNPEAEHARAGGVGDVLHTNSVEVLRHDIPEVAPAGSLLLSSRALSRVFILDAEASEVLWIWGAGELDGQHDATQLENGHLLLFDNGLRRGAPSRVLEVDARERRIVWSYRQPSLYSQLRGSAQQLPSSNVLITESDRGHAFEVTRDGNIVWEFWNPDIRGTGDQTERGVIYRFNYFPRSFFAPLRDVPVTPEEAVAPPTHPPESAAPPRETQGRMQQLD